MPLLHVLRVFTNAAGGYGNPLGVFVAEPSIDPAFYQPIAAALGFSETVFVEDPDAGSLRIFTPAGELPFAGHPLVGTAWLLDQRVGQIDRLRPPAGTVDVLHRNELTWIRGRTAWCPSWTHVRVSGSDEVEAAAGPPVGHDHVQVWSFAEAEGTVRARVFAPRYGVAEDEACGSASMILAERIGRPVTVIHGKGSEIFVGPAHDGTVELGGRVVADQILDISLADIDVLTRPAGDRSRVLDRLALGASGNAILSH